jgi:hypothetical protein
MHGSVKDKVYKMGIGSPTREMLQNTASSTIKLPVPPVFEWQPIAPAPGYSRFSQKNQFLV